MAQNAAMPKVLATAMLRAILPGLVLGGLCGAAVAFEFIPPFLGVASAIAIAIYVGLQARRIRRSATQKNP